MNLKDSSSRTEPALRPRVEAVHAARPEHALEGPVYGVVIPAFQCEASIGDVVRGVRRHLGGRRGLVVVIDDGSTDRTFAEASEAGADVVRLDRNSGKGCALRTGIARAAEKGAEALILMDGDGQHAAEDLPRLCDAWETDRNALVIGHRLHDPESIPPARYWTNRIGSQLLSWMTGYLLLDSQSGYRVLSTAAAQALDLRSDGYAIESEILLKAARRGLPVHHVEVRTIYGSEVSHFQPVRDTTRISLAALYFKIVDDA